MRFIALLVHLFVCRWKTNKKPLPSGKKNRFGFGMFEKYKWFVKWSFYAGDLHLTLQRKICLGDAKILKLDLMDIFKNLWKLLHLSFKNSEAHDSPPLKIKPQMSQLSRIFPKSCSTSPSLKYMPFVSTRWHNVYYSTFYNISALLFAFYLSLNTEKLWKMEDLQNKKREIYMATSFSC